VDTIIFIVLLVAAIFAAKGSPPKIVVPLFFAGFVLTAFVFHHHVTSKLDLSF
jgi:fatty acid desaturase